MKKEELKLQHVTSNIKKDLPFAFDGHYSPIEILEKNTSYKMVISKRSDGKTFAFRLLIYYAWQKYNYTSVIVRRLSESIKKSMIENDFSKIFLLFPEINYKKYDGINCYNGVQRGYWLDEKGKKKYDTAFVEYLAVSTSETTKSSKDYQNLFMILFDEFCSRSKYLPDEFNLWCNLLSTIIRETIDCTVVMLANPVSFVSPYFSNYGIKPLDLLDNTITVYKSDKSQTSIAIEKVGDRKGNKKVKAVNDRFFGFEKNNKLKSITSGIWETPMYPRLKKQNDEIKVFDKLFFKIDDCILRVTLCNSTKLGLFVRVHEFYEKDFYSDDLILDVSDVTLIAKNVYSKYSSHIPFSKLINYYVFLYQQDKFFYSDNIIGDTTRIFFDRFLKQTDKYI